MTLKKSTYRLKKSVLTFILSLLMTLWPNQTRAMELTWSKAPEMTLKVGDFVPYEGILVPPLNYQNYKTIEKMLPEFEKFVSKATPPAPPSVIDSPLFWGVVGALVGVGATIWATK